MIEAFIQKHGVTVVPACHARGVGFTKPTALGLGHPETFASRPPAGCREEGLAKAKILTMLENLAGKSKEGTQRPLRRDEAYRWFFEPGSDFEDWCDTAGYDIEFVRQKARRVHTEGMPEWRAKAGAGKRYLERKAYRARAGK